MSVTRWTRCLRSLPVLMLAAATLCGADADRPWTDSFTMTIGGRDRTFADYHGGSYLVLDAADLADRDLLVGRKDVVITAKFERGLGTGDRLRVRLSAFPSVIADGDASLFTTRLEGDNLYFFGSLSLDDQNRGRFDIVAVESAPSDALIIANRLAQLKPDDYLGRLKAGAEIREKATNQPNKEFWLAASDNVVSQTINDAAQAAAARKDFALLGNAISWATDILRDPARAGEIGSAPWIRTAGGTGADEIARRLRRLGLEWYKDRWRPRAEALSMEFEDRFTTISWRDVDQYYRLGRWADVNGEFLPQAKDRSYRCYQAGYRTDPNHQGIRNELGLPNTVRGDGTQTKVSADFQHAETGTLIPAPQGWNRGDKIEGDITWIDPGSETAYIAASVSLTPAAPEFGDLWQNLLTQLQSRPGFSAKDEDEPTFPQGVARRISFSFSEGRYLRHRTVILAVNPTAQVAVRLDAAYADEEATAVQAILTSTFDRLVIPNQAPTFVAPPKALPPGQRPPLPTPPGGGRPPGAPQPQPPR